MYSIKNNILYFFIVLIAVIQVQSLVELRKEDKDLAFTEAAIRKTVNSIFSILKLDHLKHTARFGEFATIHNYFASITSQDDDLLKKTAKLTRVARIDNNTQHFITQLNEVLNEDNKSNEPAEDDYVTAHIDTFIRKLEYLKLKYGFAASDAKLGINTQVLSHLISDDDLQNITKKAREINDMDGDLLSNDEFWNPSASRRIYGGRRETIKRFPFMASVQFFKKFQCGGSIIKSDLVITSASCLQLAWNNRFFRENPAFLSVQVGSDLYEGGDENIPILEVYFHPEYNPKNLRNNLAIMRLVRILKFGKRVTKIKKIDFDRQPHALSEYTPGITILGWGARHSSNKVLNVWKNRLASAVLDFYPLRECQEVYSKEFVSHKNFCAGFFSKGGGACNVSSKPAGRFCKHDEVKSLRDAGGPGVAGGKLMGVVSFGAPNCGSPDAPTVFTKLGYYTDWIEGILEMEPPTHGRSTTPRPAPIIYDANSFVRSTKENFRVTPIVSPLRSGPIPSSNALRNIDENEIFKEFITTMFGSEEVKEYLDQFESDSDKSVEATTRHVARFVGVKPTTEPTTEANTKEDSTDDYDYRDTQKGSVRMVTSIDNFDEPEVQNEQNEETTPTLLDLLEDGDIDEEVQAEQNIAKLIDDIDIEELLASDTENEKLALDDSDKYSEEEVVKPDEPKRHEEDTVESTVEILLEVDESPSTNTNDDLTHTTEKIIPTTTTAEPKVKKHRKKKNEHNDVTFRQNSTGGILDIFSQNDLLKLFHEAVADAAAQNAKTATAAKTAKTAKPAKTAKTATTSATETQYHMTRGISDRREAGLSIPFRRRDSQASLSAV